MNTIEELIKRKIPFAVGKDVHNLRTTDIENASDDYFIVCHKRDKKKIEHLNWHLEENKKLVSIELLKSESLWIDNNINLFEKVLHNGFGRILELKGRSFKAYYNKFNTEEPKTKKP